MSTTLTHRDIALEPDDGERLANLSGPFDEHLRQIELRLGIVLAEVKVMADQAVGRVAVAVDDDGAGVDSRGGGQRRLIRC